MCKEVEETDAIDSVAREEGDAKGHKMDPYFFRVGFPMMMGY